MKEQRKQVHGLNLKKKFLSPKLLDCFACLFRNKRLFLKDWHMIEFVRFYAHYRKKKRVFLWVLQSINNIFNCNCPPLLPPPPQNFLDPSAHVHWSFFPKEWLSSLRYLGLFYFSDRKDLHVIFLYVNRLWTAKSLNL